MCLLFEGKKKDYIKTIILNSIEKTWGKFWKVSLTPEEHKDIFTKTISFALVTKHFWCCSKKIKIGTAEIKLYYLKALCEWKETFELNKPKESEENEDNNNNNNNNDTDK